MVERVERVKRSPEYYRNVAIVFVLLATFDLAQAFFRESPYRLFACAAVIFYGVALYHFAKWREALQDENGRWK